MKKIAVLIVDDHPFFRSGVAAWLNQQSDLSCCGEADNIPSARQAAAATRPDIILLDLHLGDGDGLDLLHEWSGEDPPSRSIILSQSDEDAYAHRALRAGARGYVMKSEATEVVLTAIEVVMQGGIYLSRPAKARLLHNLFPDPASTSNDLSKLTDRELQVFQLVGSGCGPREVAERLKISPKTVDTYREHLKDKLNLPDGAALLRVASLWVMEGKLDLNASRHHPA